jgi:anti-sigma factor ChrR (cupin superfamily)
MKHQTVEEAVERASLYALGALDEHEARSFETHLAEGCDVCAREVESFDPVVAALGACPSTAAPSPTVREKLSAFLTAQAHPATRAETSTETNAKRMLMVRAGEGEWDQFAKGVYRKTLFEDRDRGTTTSLIKIQPGAYIPSHQHGGIEECIVLEGDVYSDMGTFTAGDYLCMPEGSVHEQLFSAQGALLFIVSAGAATF